jgi:hypothetical protein
MWKYPLTFIIISVLVTACAGQAASVPTSTPVNTLSLGTHFPQIINTPSVYMEALIKGELVLENRCLRVNGVDGAGNATTTLLIWDPRFSTNTKQGTVQVIDSRTGNVLASVGDYVAVGGGFDDNPTWMGLANPLPEDCPGPYYIVGESIEKIDRP